MKGTHLTPICKDIDSFKAPGCCVIRRARARLEVRGWPPIISLREVTMNQVVGKLWTAAFYVDVETTGKMFAQCTPLHSTTTYQHWCLTTCRRKLSKDGRGMRWAGMNVDGRGGQRWRTRTSGSSGLPPFCCLYSIFSPGRRSRAPYYAPGTTSWLGASLARVGTWNRLCEHCNIRLWLFKPFKPADPFLLSEVAEGTLVRLL